MSVRGRLVTVLDLKRRFKLAPTFTMDRRSRILLVDAVDEEIGLLVDEVRQVYRLAESEVEPPSVLGSEQPPHVVGIGRPGGGAVLLLLDLAPLLAE
jgi:purine-binding chemotaxis protein CheW